MSRLIFLDTGPLGLAAHPLGSEESKAFTEWLRACLRAGARVCIPEICDYELRREMVLNDQKKGLARLDALKDAVEYVPIATAMMSRAADLWAQARKGGKATADRKEIDGDAILAAQALVSQRAGEELVIATTNVGHLSLFASAKVWKDIPSVA